MGFAPVAQRIGAIHIVSLVLKGGLCHPMLRNMFLIWFYVKAFSRLPPDPSLDPAMQLARDRRLRLVGWRLLSRHSLFVICIGGQEGGREFRESLQRTTGGLWEGSGMTSGGR